MRKVVRAIAVRDNKLLVLKRVKDRQVYWVFPGGGVEDGETDVQALEREMVEETGFEVSVGAHFTNYHFLTSYMDADEDFYLAEINAGTEGADHDKCDEYEGKHKVDWLELSNLGNVDLRPHEVRDKFVEHLKK